MKKTLAIFGLVAALSPSAFAGDLSGLANLSQAEFRLMSEGLGSAFSYKPVTPTTPLGITGFDIGLEVTGTDISKSAAALSKAGASASTMDTMMIPKVHFNKGLPLGIDFGAFIGNATDISGTLIGGELRYALIDGGIATPAVGIRGAFTNLSGPSQLSFNTRSVDISISKGFAVITPYGGVGQVWVNSTPNVAGLSNENFMQGKVFAGASFNLGLLNLAMEADKTGNAMSWGVKMGLRW
jgi:hypothetical protein